MEKTMEENIFYLRDVVGMGYAKISRLIESYKRILKLRLRSEQANSFTESILKKLDIIYSKFDEEELNKAVRERQEANGVLSYRTLDAHRHNIAEKVCFELTSFSRFLGETNLEKDSREIIEIAIGNLEDVLSSINCEPFRLEKGKKFKKGQIDQGVGKDFLIGSFPSPDERTEGSLFEVDESWYGCVDKESKEVIIAPQVFFKLADRTK